MSNKNHPFHLVELSPWPILSAFTAMSLMMGIIMLFHFSNPSLLMLSEILMNQMNYLLYFFMKLIFFKKFSTYSK